MMIVALIVTALVAILFQIELREGWQTFLILWGYWIVMAVILKQIRWPWYCEDKPWE